MKQFFKSNIKKVVLGIIATFVIIVAVISIVNQNDLKIQKSDTTANTQADELDSTEPTDEVEQLTEGGSLDVAEEFEAELTENDSVDKSKDKPTSIKKESVTKKPTTVTKPETPNIKPIESTTETVTSTVTYNGYKPYEIFTDETGIQYYYNEEGRLCCAETLTAKPITSEYDADCCYKCGSANCFPTMSGYHCVICEKDVTALTCHPKSHYNASK